MLLLPLLPLPLLLLLCVVILLLLQLLLLLRAVVRHLVPDGKFVAGSLHLIRLFYFSSFKDDLVLIYPLTVLSHLRPRFSYILGNSGHARSQGGPAAAKPLYI